jgi:hypothetical protein
LLIPDDISKSISTLGKETFGIGTEKPKTLNESKVGGSKDIFTDLRPYPFVVFTAIQLSHYQMRSRPTIRSLISSTCVFNLLSRSKDGNIS